MVWQIFFYFPFQTKKFTGGPGMSGVNVCDQGVPCWPSKMPNGSVAVSSGGELLFIYPLRIFHFLQGKHGVQTVGFGFSVRGRLKLVNPCAFSTESIASPKEHSRSIT